MLRDVIAELGTVKVADACGVTPGLVSKWKRNNRLPERIGNASKRRQRYEVLIAHLAGVSVEELREWIAREDAA